jgi:hypothetical protein
MIIDNTRKLAVFMPPKTATHSLYEVFRDASLTHVSHDHINLDGMLVQFPQMQSQLGAFTFYAFYREPLDRALSMLMFMKRRWCAEIMHRVLGNGARISCLNRKFYEDLSPELQAANDTITPIQVWRAMQDRINSGRLAAWSKQVNWLNQPSINLILLNFHDHDAEMRRLLTAFGANPDRVLPNENEQPKRPDIDILSPEDAAEIRAFYQDDYDFFTSKGITFP